MRSKNSCKAKEYQAEIKTGTKEIWLLVILGIVSLTLKGCTGEMTGQLVGGSMGALIGSQIGNGNGKILATAIGGIAGLAIGGAMGKRFDKEDQRRAEIAAQKAALTGERVEWINESTHSCGTWYPGPIQYLPSKKPCRWLECLATDAHGNPEKLVIYAEQQSDGTWMTCTPPTDHYAAPLPPKPQYRSSARPRSHPARSSQAYQGLDGRWYQPQQLPYQAADGRWYVDAPIN